MIIFRPIFWYIVTENIPKKRTRNDLLNSIKILMELLRERLEGNWINFFPRSDVNWIGNWKDWIKFETFASDVEFENGIGINLKDFLRDVEWKMLLINWNFPKINPIEHASTSAWKRLQFMASKKLICWTFNDNFSTPTLHISSLDELSNKLLHQSSIYFPFFSNFSLQYPINRKLPFLWSLVT